MRGEVKWTTCDERACRCDPVALSGRWARRESSTGAVVLRRQAIMEWNVLGAELRASHLCGDSRAI
jgi:hypothetical protein